MTPVMKNAPLVHVVAEISFSRLPEPKAEVIEGLHADMLDAGYPERIDANRQAVEVMLSAPGAAQQAEQKATEIRRLIFRNPGKTRLVEFTQNHLDGIGRLILKVTDYPGKDSFFTQLEGLLAIFKARFPQLGKSVLKGMSLNYVDLIVPAREQSLGDLVTPEIRPPQLPGLENQSFLFGSSFRLAETAPDQRLRVAFEEVRTNNGSLTKVLPDHLVEHDKRCGLTIEAKNHWWQIPTESYGILDTQHICQLQQSPQLQDYVIVERMRELQKACSSVFRQVTTESARASWK